MLSREFIIESFTYHGKPTTIKTLPFKLFDILVDGHVLKRLKRRPRQKGIRDLEFDEIIPSIKAFPTIKYRLKSRDVGQFWIYDVVADIGFGMDKGMDNPDTGKMTLYLNTVLGGNPHKEGKKDIINLE